MYLMVDQINVIKLYYLEQPYPDRSPTYFSALNPDLITLCASLINHPGVDIILTPVQG